MKFFWNDRSNGSPFVEIVVYAVIAFVVISLI